MSKSHVVSQASQNKTLENVATDEALQLEAAVALLHKYFFVSYLSAFTAVVEQAIFIFCIRLLPTFLHISPESFSELYGPKWTKFGTDI